MNKQEIIETEYHQWCQQHMNTSVPFMKQTHQKIEPEDDLAPKYDYQLAWKTEERIC